MYLLETMNQRWILLYIWWKGIRKTNKKLTNYEENEFSNKVAIEETSIKWIIFLKKFGCQRLTGILKYVYKT